MLKNQSYNWLKNVGATFGRPSGGHGFTGYRWATLNIIDIKVDTVIGRYSRIPLRKTDDAKVSRTGAN